MKDYLKRMEEDVPGWLLNHVSGAGDINLKKVLKSRTLFYPGARDDGQPIHTFVQAHAVHVILYSDYCYSTEYVRDIFSKGGCKGYHVYDMIELPGEDLIPRVWQPHFSDSSVREKSEGVYRHEKYASLVILERDADRGEDHGPSRFAILFTSSDGIVAYDAIFCNKNAPAPFCIVLQDHGMGGNWTKFGADGMLEQAAKNSGVFPKYVLATTRDSTRVWAGYEKIPELSGICGGQNRNIRFLYQRQ